MKTTESQSVNAPNHTKSKKKVEKNMEYNCDHLIS